MRRRTVDERDRLAIEARLAHQESGRNLHADPPFAQDVHGEQRPAGRRLDAGPQLVVDSGHRRVDRGRQGSRRTRKCPLAQGLVLVDRKHHPTVSRRGSLRADRGGGIPDGCADRDERSPHRPSSMFRCHTKDAVSRR